MLEIISAKYGTDSQFIDIGIPADYAKFQTQLSGYKNE